MQVPLVGRCAFRLAKLTEPGTKPSVGGPGVVRVLPPSIPLCTCIPCLAAVRSKVAWSCICSQGAPRTPAAIVGVHIPITANVRSSGAAVPSRLGVQPRDDPFQVLSTRSTPSSNRCCNIARHLIN